MRKVYAPKIPVFEKAFEEKKFYKINWANRQVRLKLDEQDIDVHYLNYQIRSVLAY